MVPEASLGATWRLVGIEHAVEGSLVRGAGPLLCWWLNKADQPKASVGSGQHVLILLLGWGPRLRLGVEMWAFLHR